MFNRSLILMSIILLPTLMAGQGNELKTALLVIDIQEFYFSGGAMELVEPDIASNNAARMIEKFRKDSKLIVHIRHNFEPGGEIHKSVAPGNGEKVISKDYANGFRETDLLEYLKENKIEQLVITGMQTHMCVEATTRAAADLGFKCIVIADACTTRNLSYEEKEVFWEDVHYSTLSTLDGSYATVMTATTFLQE
jgi:nicotinamidase-related amidase